MKKKMIAMVVAFILLVTNTSMAYALSPVAEVYYNTGTSTYDSSDFESKLNDAIKAKLKAGGVNPKYVSIMDASADPTSVTDSTYVHFGKDSWYIGGIIPEVETADYNHVQMSNNGKTLAFYGYTTHGYKDFMLTSGTPAGKKVITFDMDESKVNYHSMEGGGFLFNTQIDSAGKLSGYAILYVQGVVQVFQINGVDATSLHNEKNNGLISMAGVKKIGSDFPKGLSTQHSIKINVTDDTLNMWDNGEQIIKDLNLPHVEGQVYGNEFGPLVSHKWHGCQIISIFSFDNMKLFSTSSKTIDKAVKVIPWEPYPPVRYIVDINDDPRPILDGGPIETELKDTINNSGAKYVGVTDSVYEDITNGFIEQIAKGGLHVDSKETSDKIIDEIATRIADEIITGYKEAILAVEKAEDNTDIKFKFGDSKTDVKNNITLEQDPDVTTVWSSDQPSIIAPDGTVTRPAIDQAGTYVTLKATITKGGLTSEKTFTVYVKAAVPAPLTTLTAEAGNAQVTLKFPPLKGLENDDVIIKKSTDGITFTPVNPVEVLNSTSTSATITGLTNGVNYYFKLEVGSGFYTGTSNVAVATPTAPITTLTVVAGNQQATLNFPAITGATKIIVEQSTDGITFTPVTTVSELDATSTSATITGLTNNTTYYFRLSVESGEHAGLSNVVTSKPSAPNTPSTPPVIEQPTVKTEVVVKDQANGGKVVNEKITKLIGDKLKVSGKIIAANGEVVNLPNIVMNADGTYSLPKVAPGEYTLSLNVTAPNGEKLAGPAGKLSVDKDGNATLSVDLVDPYGTILDAVTDKPVAGVKMQLYWADTELNRSKGKVPGTLVHLPELPDFPPNKNHNPQNSSETGEYGWMVYADGDYYFVGEKDGYITFDSRKDTREEKFGNDSYVKDGIIHVGQTIVKFSFKVQPKVKDTGKHSTYMLGYPDGSFKPDRGISRAEVAAILSRLYTPTASSNKVLYSDVSTTNWAAKAIATATSNNWMVGTGNKMFNPNKQITRAEFAKILANMNKWESVKQSTYTDLAGHWAEEAIATVQKQGLLFDFKESNFNPNESITRVEVVRIFNQILGRKPWNVQNEQKWTDVPKAHEYYSDIMEASIAHPFEQFENGIENWKK